MTTAMPAQPTPTATVDYPRESVMGATSADHLKRVTV